ncbi:MAG: helix-turn-helix domain-containing protein [Halobacteriales archaeon]
MPDDWNNGLESEPVTTYVDETTKEVWKEHAEALGMSLSRFVESMVNAGRSQHEETAPEGYEEVDAASARREAEALRQELEALEDSKRADAVEVYAVLETSAEYETVESVADRVEADESAVYEALQTLLDEGLVEYDTMRNAYRA